MNRRDLLISQLDGLVVILAAGHEDVFALIRRNKLTWFPDTHDPHLPETAAAYRTTISNASFLLGYAYFESFLADLARDIYLRRPAMLPKDRQLTSQDVLGAKSKEDIIALLVAREVRSIFAGSIEDVQRHFERKLNIAWPAEPRIVTASRMRNCLMHNGGIVDDRLAASSGLQVGSQIHLDPPTVHDFGIAARSFAWGIWNDACDKHIEGPG